MKKGISLVALVITIIVLVILTTVVILSVTNGGIINKSNEAVLKNDVRNFQEELQRNILNLQMNMKIQSKDEIGSENPIDNTTYPNIKSYIPSITKKYEDKFVIYKGELCYLEDKLTQEEIQWSKDLGINKYELIEEINSKKVHKNSDGEYQILFSKYTGSCLLSKYTGSDKNLIIPSKVTYDGENGDNKEYNVTSISNATFIGNTNIESAVIPDTVTDLGENVFCQCTNLKNISIPNSITSIKNGAFWGCTSLEEITIPNTVTSINGTAFVNCTSLKKINLDNNNFYCFQDGILYNKDKNKILCALPACIKNEYRILNGVTSIETSAFSYCVNVTNIIMPNSVESVGGSTFMACTNLNSITLSNKISNIPRYMFRDCKSLESIDIPSSANSIEMEAFYNCKNLQTITILKGITKICNAAFRNCEKLKTITLPDTVNDIEILAFDNCKSLTNIEIPNSVNTIGESVFRGCKSLESIDIPSSVTKTGNYLFTECSSLKTIYVHWNEKPNDWDNYWNRTSAQVISLN